jgi:hypothetical protein
MDTRSQCIDCGEEYGKSHTHRRCPFCRVCDFKAGRPCWNCGHVEPDDEN